jgi:predicted phage gp36 major capsid-like protein
VGDDIVCSASKDAEGQGTSYSARNIKVWQPSISSSFREGAGIQDLIDTRPTVLDHKYIINGDLATPAASAYTMLFGDMSTFKLRKVSSGTTVLRLIERYADYAQIGFIGFMRFDSQYVYSGAPSIVVVQQSAT